MRLPCTLDASAPGLLESALRRDRWIVAVSLALLVLLCWWYLLIMASGMKAMSGEGGSTEYMWLMPMGSWTARDFVLACAMWIIMMVGMMVPSAAPVVLLYAMIARRERQQGRAMAATGVFVAGYLAVWGGFSVAAAGLQYLATEAGLMSDLMESTSAAVGGAVLLIAGAYQLSQWKGSCLAHCRSPLAFLTQHWQSGPFRMGFVHGSYCLGCCWAVMSVLFAVGVMNLAWIAGLSALVLLEKTLPRGALVARGSGVLMLVAGMLVLARAFAQAAGLWPGG
jgi:predicted metal-binding membrane protein